MPRKKAWYVKCYQRLHDLPGDPPYEGKLIRESGSSRCVVEVKGKRFSVNRAACSTKAYQK